MGQWIITGGASGIGAQLVRDVTAAGGHAVVWDINPPEAADNVTFEYVDLMEPGSIGAAAAKIEGGVEAFVHCAGMTALTSVAHANAAEKLRATFEVHVVSFVAGVQGLYERLIEGRGAVVAIASAAMDVIYPGTLAYGASKAALGRVINQLAVELGPKGIRVNGIAPGAINTPMTAAAWNDAKYAAERCAFIPLRRQGQPGTIANLTRFLVSDAGDYITGEVIYVDGGVRHGIFNQSVYELAETGREPA